MVSLSGVSKFFGDKRALGPLSTEIDRGGTVGFLGLNGAGKTTLLRLIVCDLRPSAGEVRVDGFDVLSDPHHVRGRVGYLPENPPLHGDMTVGDYLAFAGRLRGVPPEDIAGRVTEVEERTGTRRVHGELTRHLSHGFRQRVGIAQAIIHGPALLVLDEPTNGLDPVQIVEMRKLIEDLEEAHTVLISSHILPEISQTCDRIVILDEGRIVAAGSEADISSRLLGRRRVSVGVRPGPSADGTDEGHEVTIARLIESVPGVAAATLERVEGDELVFTVASDTDRRAEVCRTLVERGHDVVRLQPRLQELERLFVELVGRGEAT